MILVILKNTFDKSSQRQKQKGFTPQDIQVLAPMYRGAAGIDALNKMMQEIFNPNDGKKRSQME